MFDSQLGTSTAEREDQMQCRAAFELVVRCRLVVAPKHHHISKELYMTKRTG